VYATTRNQYPINLLGLTAQIAGLAVAFGGILLASAGTVAWVPGWIFLALFFSFVVALSVWLLGHSPDLLRERMRGFTPDQKPWDKVLLGVAGVLFVVWLILMPLDSARFRWSQVPIALQGAGALGLLASFWLFFLTFRENAYLAPVVRIQDERGQTVISTGPYCYVRHPMYAAFVLFVIGTSLLLGSWFGLIGGLLLMLVVARRAVLEERALQEGLAGYADYMGRIKYRLLPGVW
jgi:protein-S-isoprenylcysteine O-methyltransferase Ste14